MIQRKKHPKYRKKISDKKKLEIIQYKKKINHDKIMNRLYELPLDIKIKIFQLSIQKNMGNWKTDHMFLSYHYLNEWFQNIKFIDKLNYKWKFNINGHTKKWKKIYINKKYKKCIRNVKKEDQFNIISVYIPLTINIPQKIKYREWSNVPNNYWVHKVNNYHRKNFL